MSTLAIIVGSAALFAFALLAYPVICFLNENLFGFGKTISYCQIVPTSSTMKMDSQEYKLIGVRRWQLNNPVVSVHHSAESAFLAAKEINCEVNNN